MLNIEPNHAQMIGLQRLRENWKSHKSFMVYAPVGSGKTGLAALMIDGMVAKGLKVLFVAPYTVLIEQTAKRFIEYGINRYNIGYIWAGYPENRHAQIQIASADTLIRRNFPDVDVVFIDEAHIQRKKLLETVGKRKCKLIGLSGTPFAGFLGKRYECLIKPVTMAELIENGALCGYEFFAPTKPDLKGVKVRQGDYAENELAEIMGDAKLVGDVVQNWLANGRDLPTVCFAVNVAHANHVMLRFCKAGVAAEVMTADTPHEERQTIIRQFEAGETKIIVNVGVLVAGFDSDVRCIIYARPTKSEMRWIQCLGRGLRTAEGKESCLIFDHSGTVYELGFPDEIEYNYLPKDDKQAAERKQYRQEQREKKPKECASCKFMKPIGVHVCPKCGFKPLIHADVEVDETRGLEAVKGRERKYNSAEKQKFYSELLGYQMAKGYADGWTANQYRAKFGVWPKSLKRMAAAPTPETLGFIKSQQIRYAKSRQKAQGAA